MASTRLVSVNGFLMPPNLEKLARQHIRDEKEKLGPQPSPEAQFSLLDVTPSQHQAMVMAYRKKVHSSKLYQRDVAEKKVKAFTEKIENKGTLPYDWDAYDKSKLLAHPLLAYVPSDLDVQPDGTAEKSAPKREIVKVANPVEDATSEPKVVWTDEEVYMLTEGLLNYNFGILKSRGNAREKIEVLEWIWASDIHSYRQVQTRNGIVRQAIPSKFIPFSFAFCCAINGLDAHELRDALRRPLAPVLQSLGLGGPHQNKVIHAN